MSLKMKYKHGNFIKLMLNDKWIKYQTILENDLLIWKIVIQLQKFMLCTEKRKKRFCIFLDFVKY